MGWVCRSKVGLLQEPPWHCLPSSMYDVSPHTRRTPWSAAGEHRVPVSSSSSSSSVWSPAGRETKVPELGSGFECFIGAWCIFTRSIILMLEYKKQGFQKVLWIIKGSKKASTWKPCWFEILCCRVWHRTFKGSHKRDSWRTLCWYNIYMMIAIDRLG